MVVHAHHWLVGGMTIPLLYCNGTINQSFFENNIFLLNFYGNGGILFLFMRIDVLDCMDYKDTRE